jgi:glycosyltransferase 2 family protein
MAALHTQVSESPRDHLLFTGEDSRGRLRRPVDGLLVLFAIALFATASVVASLSGVSEQQAVNAARTLLGWLADAWRVAYTSALLYACVVIVAALVTKRWRLSRDLLIAVVVVLVIGFPVGRAARPDWPSLTEGLWTASGQYPALRLAAAVAVLVVAGPELTRMARLVSLFVVVSGGLGAVVLGIAYPSSILGGITLGFTVTGLVRLVFGSSAGFPTPARVLAGLTELGVATDKVTIADRQRPGSATYTAVTDSGTHLHAIVLGRDAQDIRRLSNAWQNLAYRDSGPGFATGRLQQVEHESLITLLAERAGVIVPRVLVAGLVESGDAILVLEQPDAAVVEASAAEISDDVLRALWRGAAILRTTRLAHGALNLSNVIATETGPMIVRFNRGQLAASQSALDIDMAELLVATSIAASPHRALAAALEAVGSEAVAGALPLLQRAALTPHLRDLARNHELNLNELRAQAATATNVELPEIASLRRIRLKDLLFSAVAFVAAYIIITKLAKIGFGTIYNEVKQADWRWVVVALILAQLTFITHAVSLRGAVVTPLPFLPCVALQAAIKFVNLTVPGSAGRIAINIRFLQKLGASPGEAIASGAIDGTTDTLVKIVLALLVIPLVHPKAIQLPGVHFGSSSNGVLIGLLVAVVVVAIAAMANPKWRAKLLPNVKSALDSLRTIARMRSKRLELFGGDVATQLLNALALGA